MKSYTILILVFVTTIFVQVAEIQASENVVISKDDYISLVKPDNLTLILNYLEIAEIFQYLLPTNRTLCHQIKMELEVLSNSGQRVPDDLRKYLGKLSPSVILEDSGIDDLLTQSVSTYRTFKVTLQIVDHQSRLQMTVGKIWKHLVVQSDLSLVEKTDLLPLAEWKLVKNSTDSVDFMFYNFRTQSLRIYHHTYIDAIILETKCPFFFQCLFWSPTFWYRMNDLKSFGIHIIEEWNPELKAELYMTLPNKPKSTDAELVFSDIVLRKDENSEYLYHFTLPQTAHLGLEEIILYSSGHKIVCDRNKEIKKDKQKDF